MLAVFIFIDLGLRVISFTGIFELKEYYNLQSCNEACSVYQKWLTADPANNQSIKEWASLWAKYHNDKSSRDRKFSPPLPDPIEPFIYPEGERTFISKNRRGEVVHTAKVHINKEGWRVTPGSAEKNANSTFIFLGDSTTLGYGVNDNETVSSYFASLNKNTEVINAGRLYSGPNDFLYYLRDQPKIFPPKVSASAVTIIYTFTELPDILNRTFMSSAFADLKGHSDFSNKPYYEFENGRLVFKDTFADHRLRLLFYKLVNLTAFNQVLGYEWPGHTKRDLPAFIAFFKELKEFFSQQYQGKEVKFYFAAYPFQSNVQSCGLLKSFKDAGITPLTFYDTPIDNILPRDVQLTPVDIHPTPLAHLLYAKMLTDYFSGALPAEAKRPDSTDCPGSE